MKPRNLVAKHMRQFNKPSVVPNKKREQVSSRVACLLNEITSEGAEMQLEEGIELIDDEE